MKRRYALFLVAAIVVLAGVVFIGAPGPGKVSAATTCPGDPAPFPTYTGGRCANHGYFTNQKIGFFGTTGWTWANGHESTDVQPINTITDFIKIVSNDLNTRGSYNTGCAISWNSCTHNRATLVGTAFLVDMMLGKQGTDFGGNVQAGIDYAQANFGTWQSRVQAYSDAHLVDISKSIVLPAGRADSVTFNFGADIGFYWATDATPTQVMIFHNPDGSTFEINKRCGNVFGNSKPLTNLSYNFTLGGASTTTLNDEEIPTSAKFSNSITTITSGPNGVKLPTVTEKFFILHADGSKTSVHADVVSPPGGTAYVILGSTGTTLALASNTFPINAASLSPTDQVCTTVTLSSGSGTTNVNGVITSSGGTYTSGGGNCASIISKPYMQVYGGDVSAGSGVPAVDSSNELICQSGDSRLGSYSLSNAKAAIVGWNHENSTAPNWTGAGTQYAARAPSTIFDFATNYTVTSSTGRPVSLSFANDSVTIAGKNSGNYGGNFDGDSAAGCDPNMLSASDISGAHAGQQTLSSLVTSPVVGGTPTTIVVTGNILITQNVVYADAASYTGVSDIPSLKVVSLGGSIYIANGVTQLDGTYYAIPKTDGTGGVIYTCANGNVQYISDPLTYNSCNNQLIVNGSFVAKQVQLMRSPGSLRLSGGDTDKLSPGGGTNNSGEIFNYSPEVWMKTGYDGINTNYDSAENLPPVL